MRATLTDAERRCLQAHARRALEGMDRHRGARVLEAVWHTDYPPTWTPDTLSGLEHRGLIFVREEWKDNFVYITENGWAALKGAAPAFCDELADELRTGYRDWLAEGGREG